MPPKRKDRPKSSSSDAFSPEEKKSKEANRSTSTNEAEDEVLTALSMAGDLGKKVDMILNKLQKLDNIEARLDNLHKSIASLEESFAFLEKDVQNLKDKTEKTRTKVDDLEKSVEFREVDISDMQKDLKKVQHEAEELKMQLLYQEHYSRRENLMFLGIQENDAPIDAESETENNNVENTKEVIYNFLQKELGLENAVSRFEFQRIHRVGKRSGKKPRPIIARFLRYSDREEILLRAKTSLKGKDYGVFEDMPKELYQLRKAQMKKLQNAKHNGSTAFFSRKYPDKLFIDGNYVPRN